MASRLSSVLRSPVCQLTYFFYYFIFLVLCTKLTWQNALACKLLIYSFHDTCSNKLMSQSVCNNLHTQYFFKIRTRSKSCPTLLEGKTNPKTRMIAVAFLLLSYLSTQCSGDYTLVQLNVLMVRLYCCQGKSHLVL